MALVRALCTLYLCAASAVALAATQVTPLPAPVALDVARDEAPAVATDGSGFLVVWERLVDGVPWIYYARAGASGAVLDPGGVPLGPGRSPAVAWGGADYLVVLLADDVDAQPGAVRVARVGVDGAVVAAPATVWSGAPPSVPEHPAVAWNGSAYLLAWFDYFPWLSTFGLRVSAEGAPLDAERLELSPHYTSEVAYFPSVAAAGGDWLVAWTLWSYCTAPPAGGVLYAQYATRVDAAGQVLDPAGLAVAQDAGCLTNYWEGGAAFDGAAYLVAYGGWTDPPGGGGVGVARLDPTGAPLAPTPVALSGDPPAGAVGAVYDGHAVLVSWAVASAAIGGAPGPVVAARVAPGGGVIEQGLVIAAEGSLVRTAAEGGHGLAVWLVVEPDGTPSIRGATLESVAPIAVARAGLGSGRVTSWPPGVSCGDTCTAEFYAPSVVTLTATPAGASRFEGWSGDCAGAAPTCTIAADRARSAVATFRAPPVRLAVAVLGGGSGVVTSTPPVLTCPAGKVCSAAVERGATVTLTATADPGSRFLGWLGPCSGAGACTLAMNGDRGVLGLLVRAIARVDYHPGGRAASDGSPAPAGAPAAAPDPPARGP